ncbi:DUF115 domain-containing protein [Desulfobulbus rhabdoformis]|uniref:6-hydroxymethylpterin diphosphokinase MptE-like protein n=1 Tax=Desulfobulbus rhabdoformis TaxID=34032 RepID=UPI0019658580|nr:6-hydroxymethylpterin diphosphokinase MptE-like protein [Desulfobulbus rhabdoformis]MBM9616991.1 DUF115 domain-containing protein [Desulfobulbus rhabdoformis]
MENFTKRILIFTDSRGQHKPNGCSHDIFAERLAKDPRLAVDMFLCPMKWTTTLDFLEHFPADRLAKYDHVILFTGIVEWSPRPAPSARDDLYDNQNLANASNLAINTRDYAKKIINNKKLMFDKVFGVDAMEQHLGHPFDTIYEGQKTINMYSCNMAHKLVSTLAAIPNLIFITANRFVPHWEGNFKRGRPANISITETYSDLFAKELSYAGIPLVDLRVWSLEEVMTHTCDNIHLTELGSDFIYEKLMNLIALEPQKKRLGLDFKMPNYTFSGFKPIERIIPEKRDAIMSSAKCEGTSLASLIIGVRHNPAKPERLENLRFLLQWIDFYYGDLFDVLLMEQDIEPRLQLNDLETKPYVRHEFAYNPDEYNRGWGYNVAVRYHCLNAKVVVLMDTDVLTGPNFLRDIIDCRSRLDVASPYLNIYYSDRKEADQIKASLELSHLTDQTKITNPVTVSGGIVIWNRASFMAIKGFEQYRGYSCEDRAMDVTIFNHIEKGRIRISPYTYVHLHHNKENSATSRFKKIYSHLTSEYGCVYDKSLSPSDFIHKNCQHVTKEKSLTLMLERTHDFGDPDLYRHGTTLAINGVRLDKPQMFRISDVIFPPDFIGLNEYTKREVYANTPPPDSEELAQFYNRFKGQRCFIIGNGPSLNLHDLSLLKNEYCFGVNSFYYKTRETGFRPTFYVVEDSSVMKENIDEIREFEAPFKFFPTIYRKLHPKTPNTFFFDMNRGFYEKSSPNYVVPRFSTDISKIVYCGQSVTYINLQLAYYMGFTEVYLIGMDFNYVIPSSHSRNGDVLTSDTDDPNHFHKDYFGKGKTWKDPKLDRVLMNYKMAKLVFECTGRRIYNATKGGHLEEFDRIDYDDLFGGFDQSFSQSSLVPSRPADSISVLDYPQPITSKDSARYFLRSLASAMLLDPSVVLKRIAPGGDLYTQVEKALSKLSRNDQQHQLFLSIQEHAINKSQNTN